MNAPRRRVLIADCDERVLIELERLLENEGFDTTTAWSGNQVEQYLRQNRFDALLVADQPPDINCAHLIKETRQGGWGTPVIVLQNRSRHPFIESYFMTLGAREIVHKWEMTKVRDAVHAVLSAAHGNASKTAVAGAMKLG